MMPSSILNLLQKSVSNLSVGGFSSPSLPTQPLTHLSLYCFNRLVHSSTASKCWALHFPHGQKALQTKALSLETFTQSPQRLLRGEVLNICKDLGMFNLLMTTGKWHGTLGFDFSAAPSPLEHPFSPKSS